MQIKTAVFPTVPWAKMKSWIMPSVGEAVDQHHRLAGVALGTVTVEIRLLFIPCDHPFHSSVYTQGKRAYTSTRKHAQRGPWWQCDKSMLRGGPDDPPPKAWKHRSESTTAAKRDPQQLKEHRGWVLLLFRDKSKSKRSDIE